jgi:hypothetical protein
VNALATISTAGAVPLHSHAGAWEREIVLVSLNLFFSRSHTGAWERVNR